MCQVVGGTKFSWWQKFFKLTQKMQALLAALLCAASAFSAVANTYPEPPPTFAAKDYTQWSLKRAGKSRRADISVTFQANDGSDDYINMFRLDLQGNSYERGYAHGFLLSKGQ